MTRSEEMKEELRNRETPPTEEEIIALHAQELADDIDQEIINRFDRPSPEGKTKILVVDDEPSGKEIAQTIVGHPELAKSVDAQVMSDFMVYQTVAMSGLSDLFGRMFEERPEPRVFTIQASNHDEAYREARRIGKKIRKEVYGPSTHKRNKKRRGY